MKRFLIFFAVFTFLMPTVWAAEFPDVPEDHENYMAIKTLAERNIINGYDDGTYKPNQEVNRAEAMKIVTLAFGIETGRDYDGVFPDVPEQEWFYDFVMGGHEAGIISGYPDGSFKPGDTVNLAETLKIIVLAADVDLVEEVNEDVFQDVSSDLWYVPHALYARDHNLVLGDDAGLLNADKDMTRADFAEVIYRMMYVMENELERYPLYLGWPEYVSSVLPFKMAYEQGSWEISESEEEVVFLRPDQEFLQFSASRVYPNSAILKVAWDGNELELPADEYFGNIKTAFAGDAFREFEWNGGPALEVMAEEERTLDWYLYQPDGSVMAVYTEYGDGVLGLKLEKLLDAMLDSMAYHEVKVESDEYDELLTEIFEDVLIEGRGMANLDRLPSKVIILTDTIGVGTGPVDYYYSEAVDYTFKYERSADVILAVREGETTAF